MLFLPLLLLLLLMFPLPLLKPQFVRLERRQVLLKAGFLAIFHAFDLFRLPLKRQRLDP